ncbi:serine threonine- kinase gad8 [Pyrenophora seminiperda CCB06]|uniref:Serine threonine-kinase gad8 n=1 Tax=Pyrenophora seminiperda CCB06 TaxID=1302712 RepID=A0A3M7MG77_9PLEO|nr:serine threonine- kinase gad8 [Pyrenophora seminiperda CCB06]
MAPFSLPPGVEQQFSGGHHQGSMSQGGGLSVAGSMRPDSSSRNAVAGSYSNRPQSAAGSINAAPTIHGRYSSKHLPYALVDFDKQQVFINAVSGTPENPLWAGSNTQYKFDVSRVTDLTVSLYIRNPSASPNAGRNEDIFIGTLKAPADSYVDGPVLSQTMQQQFAGWSYNRPVAGLGDAGGSVKDPSFEGVTER